MYPCALATAATATVVHRKPRCKRACACVRLFLRFVLAFNLTLCTLVQNILGFPEFQLSWQICQICQIFLLSKLKKKNNKMHGHPSYGLGCLTSVIWPFILTAFTFWVTLVFKDGCAVNFGLFFTKG